MMGYGGYGSGGSYLSPSSNLSASAPPFTLDRSPKPGSVPLVDFIEPTFSGPMNSSLINWLSGRGSTPELNPVPPPNNTYGYGGFQTVESSSVVGYGQSSEDVGKQLPYYPPPQYLSPTTHKESPFVVGDQGGYDWSSGSRGSVVIDGPSKDYPRRSLDSKFGAEWGDGLWTGFSEWKQGKHGLGSFGSKETDTAVPSIYENYMSPEAKFPNGLSRGGEVSRVVDYMEIEKHGGSLNAENLDENSFLGKTSSYMHVDYSRSMLGSLPVIGETQLQSPPVVFGSSCVMKPSPAFVIGPPSAGSSSSTLSNSPFRAVDLGPDVKDFQSQFISGNKPVYDSSQLRVLLERDDPTSLGVFLTNPDEVTNKESAFRSAVCEALQAQAELRISHSGFDRFSVDLNVNETANYVQESPEGVDHYNHAVDSPCWKGVPASQSSPFDPSEMVPNLKSLEACNNSSVRVKPNENMTPNEVEFLVHGSEKSEYAHLKGKVVQDSDDNGELNCLSNLHNPGEHYTSLLLCDDSFFTKLNTSSEGTSTPTIDVPRLVNTMHNLSELLMSHCTKGSSQLKQKDATAVQSVISNLSACLSNKTEKMFQSQESTSSGKEDEYPGDLHKGFTVDRCQLTKTVGSVQVPLDDEILGSRSVRGDQDVVDEDKTTQAFKKVLVENFNEDETQPETLLYKNLWLEAEAALCSVNYKARYNRMKIEMENSKFLKSKGSQENTNTKEAVETLSPKDESCPATKSHGLSVPSPSSHDDDVMSRFQILKCRVENSNYGTPANVDKPLSTTVASPHSDKTLPESLEEKDPSPKSPTDSEKNRDINDFDASVMARFHILKSRGESFTNALTESIRPPTETKLARFASQRTNWPIIGSVVEVGDGLEAQTRGTYRTENERVSLDWEHVRKEDLGWQNR